MLMSLWHLLFQKSNIYSTRILKIKLQDNVQTIAVTAAKTIRGKNITVGTRNSALDG